MLIFFFRFINTYNNKYFTSSSSSITNITKEGTSITTRLFKKRRHENINECDLYLSVPPISDENINPLEWWKVNETQYPNVAKMARDYLAIPSTSVPSEQCFSLGKNLITDNRNKLAGKTVRICMALKSWWKFLNNKNNE